MIRRKKLTIFTDCKDSTSVLELKKMIEGILKISPDNQQLYKDNQIMDDDKTLQEYGLIPNVAKAQCPAPLGLALRLEPEGEFEPLDITPLSSPPDLPDVMKVPETNGQESVA
ncbi:transcription elongation factor B polypeptide, putative [Pediculus humanus corporis]|uniref:Transcription elongation factor B polypeptide, putative n=1 Tax=Pediculus humanus subsp. corporis TaxID=121224 RepID=E0VZA7_PEDHC|nr:transcription elongation factor B polypeptide, putative [Pediculus humanus corporis]EEB18713.1 transcription elongation factor B polypeptide, putative [Pediculus humanus corporis]